MILGIDMAFIHTPHRALAAWYADVLGLPQGYGDDGWRSFRVSEGSRFAINYTTFPRSRGRKAGDQPQLQGGRHPPRGRNPG